MAGGPTDLRERKKARTRAHIADIAMTLFAGRGFDEVTVAEVAETADVGVSTVFKYFPTKEDLFFDRQDEVVEHLSRVLRARLAGRVVCRGLPPGHTGADRGPGLAYRPGARHGPVLPAG